MILEAIFHDAKTDGLEYEHLVLISILKTSIDNNEFAKQFN